MDNNNVFSSPIYFVLGMHKSGTTLVSKMLISAGIDMGDFDENLGYDYGNKLERVETSELNKKILNCGNTYSIKVTRKIDITTISPVDLITGKELINNISAKNVLWGFKDPRNCLTFPYWSEISRDIKPIGVYRWPEEVVYHYTSRNKGLKKLINPLVAVIALKAWCIYNTQMLSVLKLFKNQSVLLNFNKLLTDDSEIIRLESFVDKKINNVVIKSNYRSKTHKGFLFYTSALFCRFIYGYNAGSIYSQLKGYRTTQ